MTKSSNPSLNTSSSVRFLEGLTKTVLQAQLDVQIILSECGIEFEKKRPSTPSDAEKTVIYLFRRFHNVVCTLRKRYDDRPTIEITDEKDAQDLFHALLRIFFVKVKKEEPLESVAGGGTFMDFLLPDYLIGIELKMGYKGNVALRKEINDDKGNYKNHSKCSKLLVFIYDPDDEVKDPRSFEDELAEDGKMITRIYVINH